MIRLVDDANSGVDDARARLESEFKTSHRLAVYGSLAPGKQNHHIVAPLGGEWTDGFVEGDLFQTGWGAPLGYWAFRPRAGGERIAVKVLTSPKLADAWRMLDDFEGSEYRRICVIVHAEANSPGDRNCIVANLYAASSTP